mgnify:CR=1 FL=1
MVCCVGVGRREGVWNLLLLIYAMLALGIVMEKSGASALMADLIRKVCTQGLSEDWQIIGALVAIYLFTAVLTELLSNNATIAIMTPVALGVAFQFGVSTEVARAFVLTSCIAASASFITPIGYQTNTFVYRLVDTDSKTLQNSEYGQCSFISLVLFYWLVFTGICFHKTLGHNICVKSISFRKTKPIAHCVIFSSCQNIKAIYTSHSFSQCGV